MIKKRYIWFFLLIVIITSCLKDKSPVTPEENYQWVVDTTLIEVIVSEVDSSRIWQNLLHLTSYPDRANYGDNIVQAGQWLYDYMENLGFEVNYHKYLWDPHKIVFSSGDHGFIRNDRDHKRTMVTYNGGETWQYMIIPEGELFFLDEQRGFLTQHGRNVQATTDGGYSWEIRNNESGGWHIFFLDEKNGWIDDDNMLYRTRDGGYNWEGYDDTWHRCANFFILDSLYIWTTYGNVKFTFDGGDTWHEGETYANTDNEITMFDTSYGISRFGRKGFYTRDGGFTWYESNGFGDRWLNKIFGLSYSHAWAACGAYIYYSDNGGQSWIERGKANSTCRSLVFTDSLTGWFSSTWGIYKTTNGGTDWDYQIENFPLEVTFENIVCTLPGKIHPEKEILLIGHYDTVLGSVGADDNGSGVVALLEIAEILSKYDFTCTIKIVFFSNEEIQRRGSWHYAEEAKQRGDDILAVINFDIIGYWEGGLPRDLNIEFNPESEWLADSVMVLANNYTSTEVIKNIPPWGAKTDHRSFWDKGFVAIWLAEAGDDDEVNPYINTIDDILEYVNQSFLVDNIKVGVVSAAAMAEPVVKSKEK